MFKRHIKSLFCWNALWLLLFFSGMGVFFLGMPKFVDDYWYMAHLRTWFEAQGIVWPENGGDVVGYGIPWQGIMDTWHEHYAVDNVRLPNLLMPIFLLFPKWVGSGIALLAFAASVFMMFRLSHTDWRRSPVVPLIIGALMFFVPWDDNFGSLNYQFNYLLSVAATLALLCWLTGHCARNRCSGDSLRGCAGALALGFFVGLCHEGVTVPLICGLVVAMLLSVSWRNYRCAAAIVGLASAVLVLMSVPGMRIRVETIRPVSDICHRLFELRLEWSGLCLLLLCIVGYASIRGLGNRLSSPLFWLCVVNALVTAVIGAASYFGRTSYWLEIMSLTAILILVAPDSRSLSRKSRTCVNTLSVVVLSSVYLRLAFVGYYSLKYRDMAESLVIDWSKGAGNNVFGRVDAWFDRPAICGYMPVRFYPFAFAYSLNDYFGYTTPQQYSAVIPEALRRVDAETGILQGDSISRLFGGYYFAPAEVLEVTPDNKVRPIMLRVDFGNGDVNCWCFTPEFVSGEDGRKYIWICPDVNWYVGKFKKIKSLKIAPYE